jgi:SAM-dependent methyltransferase
LIPSALRSIARAIYHKAFRLQLRTEFWCADRRSKPPSAIPIPPAILRYRVSELLSVSEFLRIGEGCASLIRQRVGDMGIDIGSAHRVLDFGCGCGRTIGWLLRDCSAEFHGVDVDRDAVDWCKNHLGGGNFMANAPIPPLPYPDKYFDVVYCLSVFTHLNESMQDLWIEELSRILKPGGVLLLTIYGKGVTEGLDEAAKGLLKLNGFVHRSSRKLTGSCAGLVSNNLAFPRLHRK